MTSRCRQHHLILPHSLLETNNRLFDADVTCTRKSKSTWCNETSTTIKSSIEKITACFSEEVLIKIKRPKWKERCIGYNVEASIYGRTCPRQVRGICDIDGAWRQEQRVRRRNSALIRSKKIWSCLGSDETVASINDVAIVVLEAA